MLKILFINVFDHAKMHICAKFGCIIMKGSIDVDILWSFGIATCFVRAPCHFASRACSIAWHYLPIHIDVFHIKCSHLLTSKMVLNHLYRRICVMTLSLDTCFPLKNTLLSLNQASKGVGVGFGSICVEVMNTLEHSKNHVCTKLDTISQTFD
jgi:hypothetical protein